MNENTLIDRLFALAEKQGKQIDLLIEENKSLRSEIQSLHSRLDGLNTHLNGLMGMLDFESKRADDAELRLKEAGL